MNATSASVASIHSVLVWGGLDDDFGMQGSCCGLEVWE